MAAAAPAWYPLPMNHAVCPTALPTFSPPGANDVVLRLQKSELFRDYQQAFQNLTGLPLTLRAAGSFHPPLEGSRKLNPFCALMAGRNKTCAACLQVQQRIEDGAGEGPRTMECFAGLSESAVPVKVGETIVGFLQTGQVLRQTPTAARFRAVARQLEKWNTELDLPELKGAYLQTRVVPAGEYASVINLLRIFAQHLAAFSNEIMLQQAVGEVPAITRAREFIAEHQAEVLSLKQVAQAAHISEFYFCKVFKQATGLTFTQYLARTRVETVKQLLLNPHTRISEACYEAGFQSLSQFNRVFHRITGESPTEYRDRLHLRVQSSDRPGGLSRAA